MSQSKWNAPCTLLQSAALKKIILCAIYELCAKYFLNGSPPNYPKRKLCWMMTLKMSHHEIGFWKNQETRMSSLNAHVSFQIHMHHGQSYKPNTSIWTNKGFHNRRSAHNLYSSKYTRTKLGFTLDIRNKNSNQDFWSYLSDSSLRRGHTHSRFPNGTTTPDKCPSQICYMVQTNLLEDTKYPKG